MAPADEAVARFLGARNVLHGVARRGRRAPRPAARAAPRCASRSRSRPAPADLVVRPEDVQLWRARPQAPRRPRRRRLSGDGGRASSLQGGFVLVRVETPDALDALIPARDADASA